MRWCKGLLSVFLFLFMYGCNEPATVYPYIDITLNSLDSLRNKQYAISPKAVKWYIDSLRLASKDTTFVDLYVNRYYANGNPYIWIDMRGASERVDSLVDVLSGIENEAISKKTVFFSQITEALGSIRRLDFKPHRNINYTLASLEYFSTKAFLRYVAGMHFGFINPGKFMNRLEMEEPEDSLCEKYRTLYDIPTQKCDRKYLDSMLACAASSILAREMRNTACRNRNYTFLREQYARKDLTLAQRRALAVNMERFRWQVPSGEGKYVWINVPDFILRAMDEGHEALQMKVCVGSRKHKTPLLTSRIKRLELNPVWTVPQSIIRREIAVRHAEDEEYFERNNMRIIDKTTEEEVMPGDVSAEMLKSGNYRVVQDKGEANSLGRMIFRFDNDFAIYLHDTPNRRAFNYKQRTVSHGCIRLEKPLELAVFLLDEKDPLVIDKIKIAIDLPPDTEKGKELANDEDYKRIGLKTFKPEVPLYITYYTACPDNDGNVVYTSDPYGYDERMSRLLGSY